MKKVLQHIVDDLIPVNSLDCILKPEELVLFQSISEAILNVLEGNNEKITVNGEFSIVSNGVLGEIEGASINQKELLRLKKVEKAKKEEKSIPWLPGKNREEVARFTESQFSSDYECKNEKGDKSHYGRQELRELLDCIYKGEPGTGERMESVGDKV